MKKNNGLKGLILVIVMAALVVSYYFHISNKVGNKTEQTKVSEVQEVLLRDVETDYPPTPKEVVKYYAAISKCFYDGNYTDDELLELAERARCLYDEELKATQTEEAYIKALKEEIKKYKENSMIISSYSTSSSVDVEYKTTEKGELASLYCLFNIRQGSTMVNSNQLFLLRRDNNRHWKILGWTLVKENGLENGNNKGK